MESLISIVVPAYNEEKYLKRIVDALLEQTYKNFELLLIDDGSTDSTPEICDEYSKKDGRVKVVHKQNGGLSDARNAGIKASSGEYITFVDSDDLVKPTYLEYLAGLIDKFDCKLAVCGHETLFPDGKVLSFCAEKTSLMDSETALGRLLYHEKFEPAAWAKIYHRSLFDGILFPFGKLFEDIAIVPLLIDKAGKIALGNEPQYYYIIRNQSIVTSNFSPKKMDLIEMTDNVCDKIDEKYPSLKSATHRRRVYARFSTVNQMLDTDECSDKRSEFIKYIKQNSKSILRDKRAPRRDKIGIAALTFGFGAYRFFWKQYIRIFK